MFSKNKNNYVVIIAGGVGSRFWPKSRNQFPKQFIDILGVGKSLLQLTYERFLKICNKENIYILTNSSYENLIKKQLPEILDDNILLEPTRNNTAPCIAYANYKIMGLNPNANIVVAPSDHLILKEEVFLDKIEQALNFSSANRGLVTLGINPTRPDTGYGYINFSKESEFDGILKVSAFLEKPAAEKAKQYLASGDYLWNAGIFIWSCISLRLAFEEHAPEIAELFEKGNPYYNTPAEVQFINNNYPFSPNISIDYAVLEKATNVFVLRADIGWSDLGTWASLYEAVEKDGNNNVVNCNQVDLSATNGCIIDIQGSKAAIIKGLSDYIIVDDGHVLLIYPKNQEQEIKKVSERIVQKFGESFC